MRRKTIPTTALLILLSLSSLIRCSVPHRQSPPPPSADTGRADKEAAQSEEKRSVIRVLSLNVNFRPADLDRRISRIIRFLKTRAHMGEPVDYLLLQEVAGGLFFLGVHDNFAEELKRNLERAELRYNVCFHRLHGLPFVMKSGNAILSLESIQSRKHRNLPFSLERATRLRIAVKRGIQLVRVDGFDIYNVHLCAKCSLQSRLKQARDMLEWIHRMTPEGRPVIIGGDFNVDPKNGSPTLHEIRQAGFIDSYAVANDCVVCCSEEDGREGCTKSPGNPYSTATRYERTDFIFVKNLTPIHSVVVFNQPEEFVSNHFGVLSTLEIPDAS